MQLAGERRRARPVAGVEGVVLAAGVVEEPEQEDDVGVRAGLVGEREAGGRHAAPVELSVHLRVARPRARDDRLHEGQTGGHGVQDRSRLGILPAACSAHTVVVRRLTDRQIAVLAAVERLGRPTLPDLRFEFPELYPSTVLRCLRALEARGLVESSGNRHWVYLGVGGFGAPAIPPDEIVRFRVRPRGSDTPRERLESRGA